MQPPHKKDSGGDVAPKEVDDDSRVDDYSRVDDRRVDDSRVDDSRVDDSRDAVVVCHTRHGSRVGKQPVVHAELIRHALTVRPQVSENYGSKKSDTCFPVYMESANYLYVPRHVPWRALLPNVCVTIAGEDACIRDKENEDVWKCTIALRENQLQIATDTLRSITRDHGALLAAPCGMGKCLAPGTPVMLYSGECVDVEAVRAGDLLMGDDSSPRLVLSVCTGEDDMYTVVPEYGDSYTVNAAHILCVQNEISKETRDMSVCEFIGLPPGHAWRGYRAAVAFASVPVPDDETIRGTVADWASSTRCVPRMLKISSARVRHFALLTMLDLLHDAGEVRDTPDNWTRVRAAPERLAEIAFIARSLGIAVRTRVNRRGELDLFQPTTMSTTTFTKVTVAASGWGRYHGFEITGNGRFLLGDCTVTHNTVVSVWLMAQLRVRTLVMVHKTFLMTQFEETLSAFCPNIRVGTIQGKTYDVDGKHVVLGMLQTLCNVHSQRMPDICSEFDFVVVDECHHIAAKVFSRAMLRFPATYTLGLSATPERKDGLTHVIKWFLGSTAITPKQKEGRVCEVRLIDFNHDVHDGCCYGYEKRRQYGNQVVMIPTMISDMVKCEQRTRFIADVVLDILGSSGNSSRNVLVVTDRVDHARTLALMLQDRPGIHPGLYIGCMKQQDRDRVAKECNVIFGTYALTREGLDIQKLDTLVMATPTGDVVQTAGRIMRAKGDNVPLIIDILDAYSVFVNQAKRRQKFYRMRKYDVHSPKANEDIEHDAPECYGAHCEFTDTD